MDQLVQDTQPPTPLPEDGPPPPVEIEIEAEEGAAPPPADAAPAETPKPRHRATNRVQQALSERDQALEQARLATEAAERWRNEAEAAKRGETAAVNSGMENYAQRIKTEADSAQRELENALNSGDAALIAAANRKVAKVAAAEADVDAWRASQPETQAARPAQEAPAAQQQQAPAPVLPSEPTLQFFEENPWFHPLKLDSRGVPMVGRDGRPQSNPDFDAEMHDAAMLLHKKMERQVRLGKKPDGYIESPEYFADIMAEMQANFPDAFEDSEPAPAPTRRTPPMGTPRQPVAPATRGAPAASAKTQKITLDGETASFVRGLVDNGTMRYPRSHPDVAKRGQPMEYNDAYKEYARQRQMQPQQSQN